MDRRSFVTAFAGLVVRPSAAAGQQATRRRIGILAPGPPPIPSIRALSITPMRERGWIEGENVTFERRYADGRPERLPAFAAELVGLKVDVIVALLNEAILAARRATQSIPIVMVGAADPVGVGFVESLSRPGGNVTGVSIQSPEFGGKVLEVLKDAFPGAHRVALLWEPAFPGMRGYIQHAEKAAATLGVTLRSLPITRPADVDAALSIIGQWRPDALYLVPSGVIFAREREIVTFANGHALPAIYTSRSSVDIGGLMSYSASLAEMFRRTAVFVDKILRGTRPADLPVEQPTKFELVINLKTAKALGLTIPQSVLLRADQLID